MHLIYQAANSVDAHLIRQLLESEGIPAYIVGEFLQGGIGELPADTRVRVMVAEQDMDRARAVLADWERGAIADPEALDALAAQTEAADMESRGVESQGMEARGMESLGISGHASARPGGGCAPVLALLGAITAAVFLLARID